MMRLFYRYIGLRIVKSFRGEEAAMMWLLRRCTQNEIRAMWAIAGPKVRTTMSKVLPATLKKMGLIGEPFPAGPVFPISNHRPLE